MLVEHFKVLASDCDCFQRMKISSLLKMAEEISIKDTTRLHMGREKTLDCGLLWVISRLSFAFRRLPSYDETCFLMTLPEKRERQLFPRYYKIKTAKGELLGEGEAIWALIDEKTRKPVDPKEHLIRIPSYPFKKELNPEMGLTALPDSSSVQRKVLFSELDLNGHMTNTAYADWIFSMKPSSFYKSRKLISFRLAFFQEAVEGDTLTLSLGEESNRESILGSRGESKIFQAYLEYK
jgi:medium-chain acyl-[acyl-carrier-protein] hydrolase